MPQKAEVERIQGKLDRLTDILGRLAPITVAPPSLFGDAPNFIGVSYCWTFEGNVPDLYRRVRRVITDFHGKMQWSFNLQFNEKGACIAALARSGKFYSPTPESQSLGPRAESVAVEDQPSLGAEIDKLSDFLESELGVIGVGRKPSTREPFELDNPYDFGVIDATLIRDVRTFRWPTPTSDVDRTLNFGLTYEEWYALFFQVLGKSEIRTEIHPVDFQGEIEDYPLLSRLNDIHDAAIVERSEAGELEGECLRAEAASTNNVAAQRCLRKLLLICRWAESLKTGIYFSGQ